MKTLFKYLWHVLIAVVLIAVLLGAMYIDAKRSEDIPKPLYGVPAISERLLYTSTSGIAQVLNDDQYLYVLFDEHEGIVLIYDLETVFQQSISFYKHMNGAFRIAVADDKFLVRDKRQNLYIFGNGEFESFLTAEEAQSILETTDFEASSNHYEVRSGSVWKVTPGEEQCVIQRPAASAYNRSSITALGAILIVFVIGIIRNYKKRRQ